MDRIYLHFNLCTHIPISLGKIPRNEIAEPKEYGYFYNWVKSAKSESYQFAHPWLKFESSHFNRGTVF